MPIQDLETIELKLRKRGFRRDDLLLHECTKCGERAVLTYVIMGKIGGRDIRLCQACGVAVSFRSDKGQEDRVEDVGFDLKEFLA